MSILYIEKYVYLCCAEGVGCGRREAICTPEEFDLGWWWYVIFGCDIREVNCAPELAVVIDKWHERFGRDMKKTADTPKKRMS